MKTALIVEGGGMKCAYSAGVLDIFNDHGLDKVFDYGVGVSAGAANLASFEAGQRDRNYRYYLIHSQDPRYYSFSNYLKTGSIFGLQYIYGTMTNEGGGDPLDYDAMLSCPMDMWFPATDAESGQVRYFNKKDLVRNDYRPIMASCCLPAACKAIEYEGHYYYDGGVVDSIPVEKAIADGCDRFVFISSKPKDYVKEPEGFRWFYTMALKKRFPKAVEALNNRHINYNRSLDLLRQLEKEGKAMFFCPPDDVKIGTFSTDPKVVQKFYDAGIEDASSRIDQVIKFLEK